MSWKNQQVGCIPTKSALCTQLWDYAHGRDPREVEPSGVRKTVGCEINYGVRFDGQADADRFVDELAVQVGLFY